MVRIPGFHCPGWGSVPDRGTEIPQGMPGGQKNKTKQKKCTLSVSIIPLYNLSTTLSVRDNSLCSMNIDVSTLAYFCEGVI